MPWNLRAKQRIPENIPRGGKFRQVVNQKMSLPEKKTKLAKKRRDGGNNLQKKKSLYCGKTQSMPARASKGLLVREIW